MMDQPLLISSILRFAARNHPEAEIVSRTVEGPIHRYRYPEWASRTARLANALVALGMAPGDRVGTLAWNGYRHLELYFAISGMGGICHTINPRLFPDQLSYIINHAEDQWVFTDLTFVPLLEGLADRLTGVRGFVVMTDAAHMPDTTLPNVQCYEGLLEGQTDQIEWPVFDENTASSMCYTSGTTGHPKGVVYSHRSTVLHSYAICLPDAMGLSARDAVLPVVPMFHVNAWGTPYGAPVVGAKLVFPGPHMDGESLQSLIQDESVTLSAGVPTIWAALLQYLESSGKRVDSLQRTIIGGSSCPETMIRAFRDRYEVEVLHAWGMTETSPIGVVNVPKPFFDSLSDERRFDVTCKQGRGFFGIEMKIADDENRELPWDGTSVGALKVRGPWVCSSYYRLESSSAHDEPGWFETGDVGAIDEHGYLQLTDRTKDLIKSGGEWISSIELENIAVGHPDVIEAAVIAARDDRWGERPLLIVIKAEGSELTEPALLSHYQDKVAKWQIPDAVVFVDELPHTATGKLSKLTLREQYQGHLETR
jgi:fatty-acyl-CoA synthase